MLSYFFSSWCFLFFPMYLPPLPHSRSWKVCTPCTGQGWDRIEDRNEGILLTLSPKASIFRELKMKKVYLSTPTGERGWIVSGRRWILYPAFWRRSRVQRRKRYGKFRENRSLSVWQRFWCPDMTWKIIIYFVPINWKEIGREKGGK